MTFVAAVICLTQMTFDYQYIDPGPDDPGCKSVSHSNCPVFNWKKNRYFALNVSIICSVVVLVFLIFHR